MGAQRPCVASRRWMGKQSAWSHLPGPAYPQRLTHKAAVSLSSFTKHKTAAKPVHTISCCSLLQLSQCSVECGKQVAALDTSIHKVGILRCEGERSLCQAAAQARKHAVGVRFRQQTHARSGLQQQWRLRHLVIRDVVSCSRCNERQSAEPSAQHTCCFCRTHQQT